jgi:hypothetical protein
MLDDLAPIEPVQAVSPNGLNDNFTDSTDQADCASA